MRKLMKILKSITLRIFATFTAQALAVIGAGAVAGVPVVKAMLVAGLTAVATVVEKLARAYMADGILDEDEINAAFAAVDSKATTAADLKVEARQSGKDVIVTADKPKEDDPDYN